MLGYEHGFAHQVVDLVTAIADGTRPASDLRRRPVGAARARGGRGERRRPLRLDRGRRRLTLACDSCRMHIRNAARIATRSGWEAAVRRPGRCARCSGARRRTSGGRSPRTAARSPAPRRRAGAPASPCERTIARSRVGEGERVLVDPLTHLGEEVSPAAETAPPTTMTLGLNTFTSAAMRFADTVRGVLRRGRWRAGRRSSPPRRRPRG